MLIRSQKSLYTMCQHDEVSFSSPQQGSGFKRCHSNLPKFVFSHKRSPILQTIGRIGKVSKVLPSGDIGIEYKLGGGNILAMLLQVGPRTIDWVFNPACLKKVLYSVTT